MNFYGTETGPQYTISGRLIPWFEAMHRSIMKAGNQPLKEPQHSACLPEWVHNICDELTKTVFKRLIETAPRDNKFVARDYGRMTGMMLRGAVFYLKEAPAMLKKEGLLDLPKEKDEKLEHFAGLPVLFSAASQSFQKPITNEDELIQGATERGQQKVEEILGHLLLIGRHLLDQPIEQQHEFLCGIAEGFISLLNYEGDFAGKRKRFETFLLLIMYWPEIAEMQKAQPPKTRKDLLEWLEREEGRLLSEDPKVFFELCGDIGLDLALPGHPPGASPA